MLTAKLLLDRLDKEGRLLDRREQPSRSFTKGFLELLYIAHAQIASGSPYSMTDIRGAAVDIDTQVYESPTAGSRASKPNLAIGSPPGSSQSIYPPGAGANLYVRPLAGFLLGEHLGIQVGGGTTAVTPTDTQLETRFGHGVRPADGANASFENYKTGDDAGYEIYGTSPTGHWGAQHFRPQKQHKLYSVKLLLYRKDSPGTVTVDIYLAYRDPDDNYAPFGSPLLTGTTNGDTLTDVSPGEWREITFPSQIELVPGMAYVIVVHADAGDLANSIFWRHDSSNATYPRGPRLTSFTGGSSWSVKLGEAHMFECMGRSSGELQYGGCELVDLTFSDPNGEFTIRRYFKNNSGESRTVNEVGIHAAGGQYGSYGTYIYSFLIAHDIVSPGVAVADGELLRVTYVPQITV